MNKSQLKKRVVIGSANFTQKYGAYPTIVHNQDIKKILNLAKNNSIYGIDTAENYLKKEKIYLKIDNKFKFSSKIIPDKKWVSLEFCQQKLESHFKNFRQNNVETLLFHDIKILFTKNGQKIFKNLQNLKKKKYFRKIGLSIYDTDCLNYMINNYDLDVVQCPYNILDKRILETGWFNKLKKIGIEVHARSIFLQGLLVNNGLYKKKYFKKWERQFSEWFSMLEKNKISPIDYCLSDLLNCDFDKVIIGINNLDNLKQVINFKKISINKMLNLKIDDTKLIDPRMWK
jgi:aryl-alcohol dehydrogenase-like predicted oxidoreductase